MQQSSDFKRINVDFQLVRARPGPFGLIRLSLGGAAVGLIDEPTFIFPLLEALEVMASE
jgi:hypothetical protein